jgi:hypothetical protein
MAVDNGSTDDSRKILERVGGEPRGDRATLDIWDDPEPGYFQADKMTAFAARAHAEGYDWFIPCDADEYWFSPFGRVADVLADLPEREPQALFLHAHLLNHLVTDYDDVGEPNPFRRMGWRLVQANSLPKVACRTAPELRIGMGNHEAWTAGLVHSNSPPTIDGQLIIHHFPWRSEDQFVRKITNGALAYAATNLPAQYGAHWRGFGMPRDPGFEEAVRDWFRRYGYRADPEAEHAEPLKHDPAIP